MSTYAIKAGGSGNIIESENRHEIEWMSYRRFGFNPDFIESLVSGFKNAPRDAKFAFTPGGMGAYLFLDLAKSAHVSSAQLDAIGIEVVNLNGLLVRMALETAGVDVYPEAVYPGDDLIKALQTARVVIVKARAGFLSTDALAAAAAAALNSELIIFKKGVPIYHVGFNQPTKILNWPLRELKLLATKANESPGSNSILDAQCLGIIEKSNLKTRLFGTNDLIRLPQIISGDSSIAHTSVTT